MNICQCIDLCYVINKYFSKQYKDKPDRLKIQGLTLSRPNHSLAHGMRQGFLSVNIVRYMIKYKSCIINDNFYKWISRIDKNDLIRIQFCASFMRSGRQSEVSSSENPKLYNKYQKNDVKNFKRHSDLYFNEDEKEYYSKSLLWDSDTYLGKIFRTAHRMDLRRMNKFDKYTIFKNIRKDLKKLFTNDRLNHFIRTIWSMSGTYLRCTGDRDLETQRPYQLKLIKLCYNPSSLARVLYDVY